MQEQRIGQKGIHIDAAALAADGPVKRHDESHGGTDLLLGTCLRGQTLPRASRCPTTLPMHHSSTGLPSCRMRPVLHGRAELLVGMRY